MDMSAYICANKAACRHPESLEELKAKAVNKALVENLPNIHRPWIDEIKITCPCGEELSRVSEVGDVWLDANLPCC